MDQEPLSQQHLSTAQHAAPATVCSPGGALQLRELPPVGQPDPGHKSQTKPLHLIWEEAIGWRTRGREGGNKRELLHFGRFKRLMNWISCLSKEILKTRFCIWSLPSLLSRYECPRTVTGEILLKDVLDLTVQPGERAADCILQRLCPINIHMYINTHWPSSNKDKEQDRGTKYEPYLTLFHAVISLAFSLSISSGSPVASLLGSGVRAGRGPKLPCRSRGRCRRLSTSSSCIAPPAYCTALGETEFMPRSLQSWTLLLLIEGDEVELVSLIITALWTPVRRTC